MKGKRLLLEFSPDLVDQPIVFLLAKDYGLLLNILRADINEYGGQMVVEVQGEKVEAGLDHLRSNGVKVKELGHYLQRDSERCSNCGMCVSICPFKSYELDRKDYRVIFHEDRCVGCGVCIDACPPGALSLVEK